MFLYRNRDFAFRADGDINAKLILDYKPESDCASIESEVIFKLCLITLVALLN